MNYKIGNLVNVEYDKGILEEFEQSFTSIRHEVNNESIWNSGYFT